MSTAASPSPIGTDPDERDMAKLAARWLTPEIVSAAGIRRVDSMTGAAMFARNGKDMSGLIIPNIFPGETAPREYRIRLDNPDFEYRIDGTKREIGKYLGPPGRSVIAYFPPGVTPEQLQDVKMPVIVTEGEFKALALWRLSNHETDKPRFLPIGLQGVDSWRGTIAKMQNAAGRRVSVKGMIPDLAGRVQFKARAVIIAYDADTDLNEHVVQARNRLMYALIERGAIVGFIEWPVAQGKGIDDRLATVGADAVLADIAHVDFGGWRMRLMRNATGKLLPCYENIALFLQNSPEWVNVLGYNEFTGGHTVLRDAPVSFKPGDEIEDYFDTEVVRWLERAHIMANPNMVTRVVDCISRRNSFHPVREYLESLPVWDGVCRIGNWLIDYCGVESSDNEPNCYAMAIGEKFLIAAVARIMNPGCKADHLLILEGSQGIGKSTVPRILAGAEWFSDQIADLGHKADAAMALRGRWMIEFGELDAFGRADMSRINAFITQQNDRFRPPYGRRIVEFPRQCVFIGTTNQDTWLKDETGGRRFWPARCGSIDLQRLAADRDQLWAEALHQFRAGKHWWIEDPVLIKEAREEQTGRYLEDPWQKIVISNAETISRTDSTDSASVTEILERIGVPKIDQDQRASNRVAHCLKFAKWERKYTGSRGNREWRYFKPPD